MAGSESRSAEDSMILARCLLRSTSEIREEAARAVVMLSHSRHCSQMAGHWMEGQHTRAGASA
jgi:hypothetical protein